MALLKCKRCGGYNDPSEWPEEARAEFNPELCYNCSRNSSVEADDDKEDEETPVDDDPDNLVADDEAERLACGEECDNE